MQDPNPEFHHNENPFGSSTAPLDFESQNPFASLPAEPQGDPFSLDDPFSLAANPFAGSLAGDAKKQH